MSRTPDSPVIPAPRQRADDADRYVVARVDDIPEGSRMLVTIRGWSIGIFNVRGRFHAMLNLCPHKNGPLCQGNIINWVVSDRPGEISLDMSRTFVTCPWHGYEYDIETGRSWCPEDGRARGFGTDVGSGSELEHAVEGGTVATFTDRASFDPVTHRTEGPYTATVIPLEVQEEYLIVSVAGLRERGVVANGD